MTKSTALFSRAQEVIPGGVNSPVRALKRRWHTCIHSKSQRRLHL